MDVVNEIDELKERIRLAEGNTEFITTLLLTELMQAGSGDGWEEAGMKETRSGGMPTSKNGGTGKKEGRHGKERSNG